MANILLIHPDSGFNRIGFSLTLGSIGSSLKQKGHNVSYILFDLYWNRPWMPSRSLENIDIVGITVSSCDFDSAIELLNDIREIKPNIPIVTGGAHATFDPESLLIEGVDVCVRGEGEYTIIDVVEALAKNPDRADKLKSIDGISYKLANGKVVHNKDREIIQNLDQLPFPDWYQDDYRRILREFNIPDWDPVSEVFSESILFTLMIESSRGCPFNCIFCTTKKIKGQKWRAKSLKRIIAEYDHFKDFYYKAIGKYDPCKKILLQFPDDNFCYNAKRVKTFCEELLKLPKKDRPLWSIMARANNITDTHLLKIMKKSGCVRIFMGAECGYSEGLKKIKKGLSLEMINASVNSILKVKFPILIVSWIIGFPWEKRKDALKTIIVALKITLQNPNILKTSIYTFTPLVGADITKSIGCSVKGKNCNAERYESWGFKHPYMTDKDLFELQMVARYFVFLLNQLYYLLSRDSTFDSHIASAIKFSEEIIRRIENEELKTLFQEINYFFTIYTNKQRISLGNLKKNISSWIGKLEKK